MHSAFVLVNLVFLLANPNPRATDSPRQGQPPISGIAMPAPAEPLPWEPRTCSATFDCQDGNIITCSGNSSCTVNSFMGGVTCDGVEPPCPNRCQATRGCRCGTISCWSPSGHCQSGSNFINCDGDVLTCAEACS